MSRITEILTRARDTLADPNKERWTDERLIRLIDEAQKDICRRAKLLREKSEQGIYPNQGVYKLPSDLLLLDRILFDGEVLPFKSHLELDAKIAKWEEDTGTPECVVYDKQNRRSIKLYPIPIPSKDTVYTFEHPAYYIPKECITDDFGVITSLTAVTCEGVELDGDYGFSTSCLTEEQIVTPYDSSDYGIVIGIDDLYMNSEYGVLVSLTNPLDLDTYKEEFVEDNLGVMVGLSTLAGTITVYYIRKPDKVSDVDSSLEIDDCFDSAIKYYVVGMALRDDMDTQNRTVGNEELTFYTRELEEALSDDTMDFTRNNIQYETSYKGAF